MKTLPFLPPRPPPPLPSRQMYWPSRATSSNGSPPLQHTLGGKIQQLLIRWPQAVGYLEFLVDQMLKESEKFSP